MADTPIFEMRGIDKAFNGVPVLKRADFSLRRGEVHALMGGNGAGKSTLMKILTGVYSKDAGTIAIEGEAVEFHAPSDAERHGIAMIFQEFSLVPTLTVAQNMFLHREPRMGHAFVNDAEAARRARAVLAGLGEDIDPRTPVEALSVGQCQMVEIAKALSKDARILVMDEPTSSISEAETSKLFEVVRRLKASGISIVYISHRMAEIFAICDRVTVMRDGASVLVEDCSKLSMQAVIDAMLGTGSAGAVLAWRARDHELAPIPALEVEHLTLEGHFEDISFIVHPGEIVGLAGLMGSGRTEIAEAIFGIRTPQRGCVRMRGKELRTLREAIDAGIAFVPENRRTQGLVLDHSLRDNVMLPNLTRFTRGLFINDFAGTRSAVEFIKSLRIKTDGPNKEARLLSGGNQQKIVLAKWLARRPELLILDEPTIGVDIGAKSEIVEIVRGLAAGGTAVLVISSEFEELLALSDRLVVIHDGRLIREFDRQDIESEEVLHHAVQG